MYESNQPYFSSTHLMLLSLIHVHVHPPSPPFFRWLIHFSFNREIWTPSSLASGILIQYLTTCIVFLVLASGALDPNSRYPIRSPRLHDHPSPLSSPFICRTWTNWLLNLQLTKTHEPLFHSNINQISSEALLPVWHDGHVRPPSLISWLKMETTLGTWYRLCRPIL